jgi:outer membrane lipoprotein LolB
MSRLAACLLSVAIVLIAGCAHPTGARGPIDPENGPWTGRLALQVQDHPDQSFSAGFELRGRAPQGALTLFSPIGGTLAVLNWAPGSATLQSGGKLQQFDSVDALVAQATGSAIPVAALFEWLAGRDAAVPGWQADLSQLAEGRLRAQRQSPPPVADLRVVLDRP